MAAPSCQIPDQTPFRERWRNQKAGHPILDLSRIHGANGQEAIAEVETTMVTFFKRIPDNVGEVHTVTLEKKFSSRITNVIEGARGQETKVVKKSRKTKTRMTIKEMDGGCLTKVAYRLLKSRNTMQKDAVDVDLPSEPRLKRDYILALSNSNFTIETEKTKDQEIGLNDVAKFLFVSEFKNAIKSKSLHDSRLGRRFDLEGKTLQLGRSYKGLVKMTPQVKFAFEDQKGMNEPVVESTLTPIKLTKERGVPCMVAEVIIISNQTITAGNIDTSVVLYVTEKVTIEVDTHRQIKNECSVAIETKMVLTNDPDKILLLSKTGILENYSVKIVRVQSK